MFNPFHKIRSWRFKRKLQRILNKVFAEVWTKYKDKEGITKDMVAEVVSKAFTEAINKNLASKGISAILKCE